MTDTDKKRNKYITEYVKENYKRIPLNIDKQSFYDRIIPYCKKSGIPVNTFIKQLIYERLGNPEE